MPRICIKQLDDRIATAGLFMGGNNQVRRKLQPGEVVDISEDFEPGMYDGQGLLDALWGTGKVEMTLDAATRPVDFADARQAKLSSPTFKSRGPDDDIAVEKARAAVTARLVEMSNAQLPSVEADSPADDKQPDDTDDSPVATETRPPTNRRAARRAATQAAVSGSEVPT